MTPQQAFLKFSSKVLEPDLFDMDLDRCLEFACRSNTVEVRGLARDFMMTKLEGDDDGLQEMWWSSNARIGPSLATARSFTRRVLRIIDESLAGGSAGT